MVLVVLVVLVVFVVFVVFVVKMLIIFLLYHLINVYSYKKIETARISYQSLYELLTSQSCETVAIDAFPRMRV